MGFQLNGSRKNVKYFKIFFLNLMAKSDRLVPPDRQTVIYEALEAIGGDSLRNLFDHLREAYTYDEIKIVRAIWQNEKEP
ncbi:helix-turn-helix domain-containing protein, partial [Pseudanabaena cinerea]